MANRLERLNSLEREIMDSWLKEGIALKTIRDESLYTERGYSSFADYYTEYLQLNRQMVSYRIQAATTAINVIKTQETLDTSENTYRRLSKVPKEKQQIAFDKACEIAVSSGAARVTANHVEKAVIETMGGYSPEVLFASQRWGFTEDTEKLNILQKWFDRSKDSDSKFWAVYHSGVIDPQDGLESVEFATATIEEITQVAERWRLARIIADSEFKPIIGIVNRADLEIDGMRIVTDSWQGKKVKLIVKILEDEKVIEDE